MRTCSFDGCERKHVARGWCGKHYKRWKRHGDPSIFIHEHRERGKPVDLEYIKSQCEVNSDECWIWQRSRGANGYGQINIDGKMKKVYRVSWELAHGKTIPEGLEACHTCNQGSGSNGCCNPEHIEPKTPKENMRDRDLYGRTAKGSRITNSKLDEADIPNIRCMVDLGFTIEYIGSLFGVHHSQISRIANGKTWKDA